MLTLEEAKSQLAMRDPTLRGGEKATQQAANETEVAAAPAKEQAEAQQFVDLTPNSPPEGVELVDPRSLPDQAPSYGDETEEFLFGMTSRPGEPLNFGVTAQQAPPPKNAYKYLQVLAEAAEDPNAPEQIHTFIRILQDMLGE